MPSVVCCGRTCTGTAGPSRAHAARLIATYLAGRQLADGGKGAQPFRTRYTHEVILLLAETEA